jgi:hypothetical protein
MSEGDNCYQQTALSINFEDVGIGIDKNSFWLNLKKSLTPKR